MLQAIYIDPFASPITCGVASLSFALILQYFHTYACAFGWRDDVMLAIIRDWLNKLYPNSTSEGHNDCAFPRDLLYFHGTFYTCLAERGQSDNISSR